jgi:hypothetical protein
MLAGKKRTIQIGFQDLVPRRSRKLVHEPTEINSRTREQAIGDSQLVPDDLKGFLNLFFRTHIAAETQGAFGASLYRIFGCHFCCLDIFVEHGEVVASCRTKLDHRSADAICSASYDNRAHFFYIRRHSAWRPPRASSCAAKLGFLFAQYSLPNRLAGRSTVPLL